MGKQGKCKMGAIKTTLFNLYLLSTALRNYLDRGVEAYDDVATNHIIAKSLERVWARAMVTLTKHKAQGSTQSKLIKFKISTAESEIITELIGGETINQMMNKNLSDEYRNENNFHTQKQISQ